MADSGWNLFTSDMPDDELEWHELGDDVPWWLLMLWIVGLLGITFMLVFLMLNGRV